MSRISKNQGLGLGEFCNLCNAEKNPQALHKWSDFENDAELDEVGLGHIPSLVPSASHQGQGVVAVLQQEAPPASRV